MSFTGIDDKEMKIRITRVVGSVSAGLYEEEDPDINYSAEVVRQHSSKRDEEENMEDWSIEIDNDGDDDDIVVGMSYEKSPSVDFPGVHIQRPVSNQGVERRNEMYGCSICSYTTWDVYDLKKHLVKNHGKHLCDDCWALFNSSQALGCHGNVKHRKRKDLICEVCDVGLAHIQHKRTHMKKVHGIETNI